MFEITLDILLTVVNNHSVVCFVTQHHVTQTFDHVIIINFFGVLASNMIVMALVIHIQVINNIFVSDCEYMIEIDDSETVTIKINVLHCTIVAQISHKCNKEVLYFSKKPSMDVIK